MKNNFCPFCDKHFERETSGALARHLHVHFKKHAVIKAFQQQTNLSVIELYQNGLSANEISNKICETFPNLKQNKGMILSYLKENNIQRRSTIEAMVHYYDHVDVWNKGLTKEDHPGIASYAEKREGENNPILQFTHEERCAQNIVNKLKREGRLEELEELKQKYSQKTSEWFANEENYAKYIKAYDAARPKQIQNVRDGMHAYFQKYTDLGETPPVFALQTSKPEQMIYDALTQMNLEFKHQFYVDRMSYDFFVKEYNTIIEMNGRYWHGHPTMFKDENAIHPNKHKTIKEIREYDLQKQLKPLKFGFKVIVIWDHEFNSIESVITLLEERMINAKNTRTT